MQQKKAQQRAVLEDYLKEKTEKLRNENRRNRNPEGFVILIVQYFERNIANLRKGENFKILSMPLMDFYVKKYFFHLF